MALFASVQYTRTALTSTQLLHLHSAPILIAPGPGAGRYIVPSQCFVYYSYRSSAYTGANPTDLAYQSGSLYYRLGMLDTEFQSSQSGAFTASGQAGYSVAIAPADALEKPVYLYTLTGNMAAGNGTAVVAFFYYVLTA